tara:strand:- start:16125 stop:16532 length:408 start_codon:yes stop_codon:yes gene_type:complete
MKPNLPNELKHQFNSDEEWVNSHDIEIEKQFKKTLPDKVYKELLQYYEDNHGDNTIVELNKLGFKVVRQTLLVEARDAFGVVSEEVTNHPLTILVKTQGQKRGGFEVVVAAEKDGEYRQFTVYINPMGDVFKSWE